MGILAGIIVWLLILALIIRWVGSLPGKQRSKRIFEFVTASSNAYRCVLRGEIDEAVAWSNRAIAVGEYAKALRVSGRRGDKQFVAMFDEAQAEYLSVLTTAISLIADATRIEVKSIPPPEQTLEALPSRTFGSTSEAIRKEQESITPTQKNVEAHSSKLAREFAEIRSVFYLSCAGGLQSIYVPGQNLPTIQIDVSKEGEFLIASFQMWIMFDLLDLKREQYVPPSSVQPFVDLMYCKVIGEVIADSGISAKSADNGVTHFDRLAKQGDTEVFKDFENKMRACLFGGPCWVTGQYTPATQLGITSFETGMQVDHWVTHMTRYLTIATRQAMAGCFGDIPYSKDLQLEMDDFNK